MSDTCFSVDFFFFETRYSIIYRLLSRLFCFKFCLFISPSCPPHVDQVVQKLYKTKKLMNDKKFVIQLFGRNSFMVMLHYIIQKRLIWKRDINITKWKKMFCLLSCGTYLNLKRGITIIFLMDTKVWPKNWNVRERETKIRGGWPVLIYWLLDNLLVRQIETKIPVT